VHETSRARLAREAAQAAMTSNKEAA